MAVEVDTNCRQMLGNTLLAVALEVDTNCRQTLGNTLLAVALEMNDLEEWGFLVP